MRIGAERIAQLVRQSGQKYILAHVGRDQRFLGFHDIGHIDERHQHSAHGAIRFPIGQYPHDVVDRAIIPIDASLQRLERREHEGDILPQSRVAQMADDIGQADGLDRSE